MKDDQSAIARSRYLDKEFIIKLVVAILLVFAALGLYELLLAAFQVVLLGIAAFLWSVLFRGPADWIQKRTQMKRGWATFLSVIGVLAVFVGLGMLIGPQLNKQLPQLQEQLPKAFQELTQQLKQLPLGDKLTNRLQNPGEFFSQNTTASVSFVKRLFSSVFGFATDLFVIIVVGFFFLAEPGLYKKAMVKLFPISRRRRASEVLHEQYITLKSWLAGMLFDMLIVALLTTLGLWIMGMPLAITLGVMAGLLAFIPNLGPLLAQVPALLIAYSQGGQYVLYVFILYNGVQLLESNLLLPLIQKHQVNIPPAFILLAMVLMGSLTGLLGIILTVPLLVLAMVFIKRVYLQDILGDQEVDLQAKK